MEFFNKTGAVKLRSHLDKYLVADDENPETIRQSRRSAGLRNARWSVEPVPVQEKGGNPTAVRLRSCHGLYLAASNAPFLLGMTGKKVVLANAPDPGSDPALEWEPIRDGFQVRLRTRLGKYLRANGAMPPWRNSITHDGPQSGAATQDWVLWDVEPVEPADSGTDSFREYLTSMSSFSSVSEDILGAFGSEESPKEVISRNSSSSYSSSDSQLSISGAMEKFGTAKVVRLRSQHGKYLVAEEDGETVSQGRDGASENARWAVEFVINSDSIIRLRSCHGRYLTASNLQSRLRVAGNKVLQTLPKRLDSSLEWEPIKEGSRIKLRTRYGNFLRANTSAPPWGGSVTHDIPRRTSTQSWILWDVEVVELQARTMDDEPLVQPEPLGSDSMASSDFDSNSPRSPSFYRQESIDSYVSPTPKTEGRVVYYHIADENGQVEGEDLQGYSLNFNGKSVDELTQKLKKETGIESPMVCVRSPLNGKLYPLRLQLPPNIVMHVIVVPSSSQEPTEQATRDII